MNFEFTASADRHGIPHEDAEYAVLHHVNYAEMEGDPRDRSTFMFAGLPHSQARRYLEVGVAIGRTGERRIFHAMELTDVWSWLLVEEGEEPS